MSEFKLEVIIDYAIEEEKKAAELYEETAQKVKDPGLAALLNDMAIMEKGHEAKLNSFKQGNIEDLGGDPPQDLKIGDYLV